MKKVLWLFVALALVSATLAQTGDTLRAINSYGPEYRPFEAEQLRLLAPATGSAPNFTANSLSGILAEKVVSGEYYVLMDELFPSLPTNATVAVPIVQAKAMQLCGVNGTARSQQDLTCLSFYVGIGQHVWELEKTPMYEVCRGNIQVDLVRINDGIDNQSINSINAALQFAVDATALKWCQVNFGQNITVVAPTPENTKFSPPDWWTPPGNNTVGNPGVDNSGNANVGTTAPVSAPLNLGTVIGYVAGGLLVVIIIVAIIIRLRQPRQPHMHQEVVHHHDVKQAPEGKPQHHHDVKPPQ